MTGKHEPHSERMCPNAGGLAARTSALGRRRWLLPLVGLGSLVWFLLRVIPKPSRATYPCQRMAMPFAAGFVIWLASLAGSVVAFRKAARRLHQSRWTIGLLCAAVGLIAAAWAFVGLPPPPAVSAPFVPTDLPNSPLGAARGLNPGRVVWVHDPDSTSWNGSTGNYWDDAQTSQGVVDAMMSRSIRWLAGESDDAAAWDAVFRHFNREHGGGDVGYQSGERIAIKINLNNSAGYSWGNRANPTPQGVQALLWQLVNRAGVAESAITVYDASRLVGNPIYDKCHAAFPGVVFVDNDGLNGRTKVQRDAATRVHFSAASAGETFAGECYLPTCVTEAKYLINFALFRGHSLAGFTACAKNHFGSLWFSDMTGTDDGWKPNRDCHVYVACGDYPGWWGGFTARAMGTYNTLVDLMGHQNLGGKTLLFLVDGLYGAPTQSSDPAKFQSAPFNNDWCSSLFVSQDGVAIDSVLLDFLRAEPTITELEQAADNYLHEAALAGNPPSGAVYDPENDGTSLTSLGVHEHWNNAAEKKYSQNLGTGDGIELIWNNPVNAPPIVSITSPVDGATFPRAADIPVEAAATDDDGVVVDVAFLVDGVEAGRDTDAPFECLLQAVPSGERVLLAVATDDRGTTAVSPPVTIEVQGVARTRSIWLKME